MRRWFVYATVLSMMLVFGGCATTVQRTKEAKVAPKRLPESVVAQADDCTVTGDELKMALSRTFFVGKRQAPETLKINLAKSLLSQCLMAKEAEKEGVKLSEKDERELEKIRERFLVRAYVIKNLQVHPITDEEMKGYYTSHKAQFIRRPMVKARHIVVKDEKLAKRLMARLKKGADFTKLASRYNVDASKNRGGELGWVQKGLISQEFSETAFRLKKGQMSGIVKDKFGYHIIKVEDARPGGTISFEEAKPNIKRTLEMQRYQQLRGEVLKKYKVEINHEALKKVSAQRKPYRIMVKPR